MRILVFPFDNNPYQELLYSQMRNKNNVIYPNRLFKIGFPPWFILPIFLFYLIIYRIRRFKIFHLHWSAFHFPWKNRFFLKLNFFLSKFYIKSIKFLGFKLVWTIHNLVPHEKNTSNDMEITKLLCEVADAKIAHSRQTISEMKKYKLNTKNTFIIPHGSYIGVYPNDKKNDKIEFGFLEKDFVFLFIGNIREYKGIPELLDSFPKIKNQNIKLLVAGNCGDEKSKALLEEYSKKDKRIIFKEGFIKDSEIQNYMNASDIVVFPFRRITTSGSVILASSFGKPVIYPNAGGLKELPNNFGFSYNQEDKNGLLNSMKKAIQDKNQLKKFSENSWNYAKKLSWKNISKETFKVYEELLRNQRKNEAKNNS